MTASAELTPTVIPPDVPRPFRLISRTVEADDVVTLRVAPLAGVVPEFEPAQFSMIGIVGLGEVPISISSRTDDHGGHEYTLRRAGAVTNALADVAVGGVVTVRGPFGVPWDLDRARGRHAVVVAGGIGLAPLKAAIDRLTDTTVSGQQVTVLVGARSPSDLVFGDWLRDLGRRARVERTVDRAEKDERWPGATGLVTEFIEGAVAEPDMVEAFVCGPDVMMMATVRELDRVGVPRNRVEVTLERNMQCANGWCGHCQLGTVLVCRDGPVVRADRLGDLLDRSEL